MAKDKTAGPMVPEPEPAPAPAHPTTTTPATQDDLVVNPYVSNGNNQAVDTDIPSSPSSSPSATLDGPDTIEPDHPDLPPYPDILPQVYSSSVEYRDPAAVPLYPGPAWGNPGESLAESISTLRTTAEAANVTLPLTRFDTLSDPYCPSRQIIASFFRAVRSKNDELVTRFIREGLVSPDVTNLRGETPLIAAVVSGNGAMVCTLMDLGATADMMGRYYDDPPDHPYLEGTAHSSYFSPRRPGQSGRTHYLTLRTPLMVAASSGNLALVKLLLRDFKADDAIVAPDGQLALRLAAEGSHREIVDFLPARRGGAWTRWKAHHEVAVRRVKVAGQHLYEFLRIFVWTIPKCFLWSCPKHLVVLPIKKGSVWAWENKQYFGGWCKRQVKAIPGRVKRGAGKVGKGVKALGRGVKKIPGLVGKLLKWVWRVVTRIPGLVERLLKWVWRVVKRIPGAMKILGVWIWDSLKKIGMATGQVFLKVVSAVHTTVMAVLGLFQKITLSDVWDAFVYVSRALFVDLPRAIWSGVKAFGKVSYETLKQLLGGLGQVIWWLCLALFWLVAYAPMQLGNILVAVGESIAKGWHEILIWINPKH